MSPKTSSKIKNAVQNQSAFDVQSINNKFVVTKNGEPIEAPVEAGQFKITKFDNKEDAERYKNILESLSKNKNSSPPRL